MAKATKSKHVPKDEPLLLTLLREQDISAEMHERGVLVIDHYALLDLIDASAKAGRTKPLDPESFNPIGTLQEHCQSLGKPLPDYRFESIGTEHAPRFRCIVSVLNRECLSEAQSKSQAKEMAARQLLRGLQSGDCHG